MSNPVRLPGLASGIDTDEVIKAQLTNEQTRIDKVEQSKQIAQWQQEIYRDIIGEVRSFNDKYFSVTSPNSLTSTKNYSTLQINSSNSNVLSATASPSASFSSNFEMKVESLAKEPKKVGDKLQLASGDKVTNETKLSDLGFSEDMTIEIEVNGEKKEIKITKDMNLKELSNEISKSTDGKLTGSYSELTGRFTLQAKQSGEDSSFQITGIKDIMGNDISDVNTLSNLNKLGLGKDNQAIKGSNSKVVVTMEDGEVIELNNKTNSFTIDGIEFQAKEVGTTKITASSNPSNLVETMKSFVEDYNKIIEKIDGLLSEKKAYDYAPLTKAQKEEMSEDEIEKWEKKAKEGILRNDSELTKFARELKSSLFDSTNGVLSDFGLSSPKDFSKSGQLVLDEDKLKKACEENPTKLYDFFNAKDKGVMQKAKSTLEKYVGKHDSILLKKSGYKGTASDSSNFISNQIKAYEEKIRQLQEVYNTRETALYNKFAAMESMMSKLNNQFNMLAGQ